MEDNQVTQIGVPPEAGKFCADCKHLIGVRYNKESSNWNCGHLLNDLGMGPANLVTGIKSRQFKITIYHLRYPPENYTPTNGVEVCGAEGKWHEQYTPPNYDLVDTIGGEEPVIFDEAAMAAGKEAAAKRLADLRARKNK